MTCDRDGERGQCACTTRVDTLCTIRPRNVIALSVVANGVLPEVGRTRFVHPEDE
jgi:hypothetical protein